MENSVKEFTFESPDEAVSAILQAASYLGWDIATPCIDEDEPVPGFIIGTNEYLDSLLKMDEGLGDN